MREGPLLGRGGYCSPRRRAALALGQAAILVAALALAGCSPAGKAGPRASEGMLDLRGLELSRGPVALVGSWDFFPGSIDIAYADFGRPGTVLREVPDLWKGRDAGGQRGQGCGSYRLTVLLPPGTPPLALHYLSCSTAFRVEANGSVVAQVGIPSADPRTARAAYAPGYARLGSLGERLELVVRVSNYVYRAGGMWFPFLLGPEAMIAAVHQRELIVAAAQAASIGIMGLTLLLLYALRRKEKALLYGGLSALAIAARVLVTGEYLLTDLWPSIPFELLIRVEYLTVFFAFPAATAFFARLFEGLMPRRLELACYLPPFAFVLLALTLPLHLLTRSIFAFYGFATAIILLFLGFIVVRFARKRDIEGAAILAGSLVLAASTVNDIFYSSFVLWTGNLAPWGFIVFVAFQLFVVARRLTLQFAEAEELLGQKELLIKEIHHRVKNNLQVVASLVSLQAGRVEDRAMKEVFAALRRRVVSMSLVHEKLYGRTMATTLDLGDYARALVGLLVSKDVSSADSVELRMEVEHIEVGEDACVDAGLIINELVANALKYALLPKGGGSLEISIGRAGREVSILVEDDGPGFAPGFDPAATDSLGFKLVASLLARYSGGLAILPGPGGRVRATFLPDNVVPGRKGSEGEA
jgi:two-component sensor histidine kinase